MGKEMKDIRMLSVDAASSAKMSKNCSERTPLWDEGDAALCSPVVGAESLVPWRRWCDFATAHPGGSPAGGCDWPS